MNKIEPIIEKISDGEIKSKLEKVAEYEASLPNIRVSLNTNELLERYLEKWEKSTRRLLYEKNEIQSYIGAMKKVLDYRQWYEFQLFYKKREKKRKLLQMRDFISLAEGKGQ